MFGLKCSKSRRKLPCWGSLRRSPRPPSREGLLAFGNRSFTPSALNPLLAPPKQKFPPCYPPKHKIIEPPLNWPTDHLNLAVHGSNDIVNVCVGYWGFIPKLHFKFCLILLYIIEQSEWEHD